MKISKAKNLVWSVDGRKASKWTEMTKEMFGKIGEDFGFDVEGTGQKKEFLALDQVWFKKGSDEVVLAIETENSAYFGEIIEDEFRKLLNIKSDYKILIWYKTGDITDEEMKRRMKKFHNKIKNHTKTKHEVFFIIYLDHRDNKERPAKMHWKIWTLKKEEMDDVDFKVIVKEA